MKKLANISMFESLSSSNNVRSVDVFNFDYEGDFDEKFDTLMYGCSGLLEDIEFLWNRYRHFGDDPSDDLNGIALKKEFIRFKKEFSSYADLAYALSKLC